MGQTMKHNMLTKSILALVAMAALATTASAQEFKFEAGYPTAESSHALYDEMDYQRAVQAYIWATPLLNSMGFRAGYAKFGVTEKNLKIAIFPHSILPQHTIMTANQTTPYFFSMADLKLHGPVVAVVPPEDVMGSFVDFWHRALSDFGPVGPDRGKGGKYLLLPPGYDGEIPDGYHVVQSTSNIIWFYGRANSVKFKGDAAFDVFNKLRLYPLSKAGSRSDEPQVVSIGKKEYNGDWPKDYAFWPTLHEAIHLDNIRQQDKIIYGYLRDLGITHGKPFEPDARQKRILTRAAEVGGKMVANLAFSNRNQFARWHPDRPWVDIFGTKSPFHETETYVEVDDRASAWYQLCMSARINFDSRKMEPVYGKGSGYLANYHDSTMKIFLNGSNSYRLSVPPDVPVANFWSVTVYSNNDRSQIRNEQGRISLGSTDKLKANADGNFDLTFGPELPAGTPESNWIQTNPDEGWFVLFRFFGPERPYYDRSFKLPLFEKI